jgi:hypothetical protein
MILEAASACGRSAEHWRSAASACGEPRVRIFRIIVLFLLFLSACSNRDAPPGAAMTGANSAVSPASARSKNLQGTIGDMRRSIERDVAAGFSTASLIVESAVDSFSDEQEPRMLRPVATRLVSEALAKHIEVQATWAGATDCDRLDQAFADLEQRGIVARQNFADCGTCGVAEIGDEIEAARKSGRKVRGYTFYHMQDTESAVEGHGLYLNYGSVDEGENNALEIAKEIVQTLKLRGLDPNWDGTWQQRISIKLDWKRRR